MQDLAEDNVACRICMDNKDNCVSLFSQDLSKKIMEIAAVQVEKDDGLPDSICTECENDLEKCYEFRLKVQVADKKFRENIKFSQVDIAECNIKQERYHIDDGNFDNADENDSVSMDDEHYNEELDVEQQPRSTGEVEPDPLNHVVVVEEKERKIEMAEYTLGQDDVMSEEPQLKTVEEPAVDPLVCMKEETDAEVMDVDSNQPDPFGPSVSVRSIELLDELNVEMKLEPVHSSRESEVLQPLCLENNTLSSNLSSYKDSASFNFHNGRYKKQNLGPDIGLPMNFHKNSRSFTDINTTRGTCEFSFINTTSNSSSQSFFKRSTLEGGDLTAATTNTSNCHIRSSYWHKLNNSTVTVSSHSSILPTSTTEENIHDSSTLSIMSRKREKEQNISNRLGVESQNKTKITQKSPNPNTISSEVENNDTNEFSCSICSVDCGTADLFNEHKSGKEFICRTCTAIFNNHQELETHFFGHRKHTCEFCKKVFYVKKDLIKHKNTVATCKNPATFECEICHNKYKSLKSLKNHTEKKHSNKNTGSQPVTCHICDKSFGTFGLLTTHMKVKHTVYESVECDICHTVLSGPDRLKVHIKMQHLQPVSAKACPICKKVFSSNNAVQYHLESHIGEENVCNICGAVVKGKITFKSHLGRHNRKMFPCSFCNIIFNTNTERRKHYDEKHAAPKHTVCEMCGKEFVTKGVLKEHKKIHSNEKPYVCDVCGFAFRQKVTLQTHSRIHTDLRKYCCNQCGKDFRWKPTFDKHVLKCKSNKCREK